jgi:hypothetical protein
VQQGSQTTPVKLTCEQCFTTLLTRGLLTQAQITALENIYAVSSLADLCERFIQNGVTVSDLTSSDLPNAGITSKTTQTDLIACLLQAGVITLD